ncbi:IclR family transcriptional regulator [Rhizobium sp. L1K21]|uniref:IclR family transcriptional regulator n=1 Tax=Rhizobium sp. L1K21 TaxID=2954933 RepID=UPI002091FCDD|nr:IclR family transcriptional regulator [Rhizobium sp. L1K21]MCO6187681.1 IclR family transcriptional regulator [Rhizobium sp. L1K21]
MAKQSSDTGTLGKAIAVLEAVASSPRPLRFTDLLALVDQPRGTLHRQISNLVDEGLLHTNPDHSYELGLKLLQFASNAWAGNKFRNIAEPHLAALHDKVGETIHLGVLQGVDVVYLDKVESRQAVRMHSQIGNVSPCFCTGVGKAAFSLLPADEAEQRIKNIQFRTFTPTTITDAEAFRSEIEDIRGKGYGFDREEHETGIHCVAAPIISETAKSIYAGISITAPVYRVPMSQLENWSGLVRETAAQIAEDMSVKLGPRG